MTETDLEDIDGVGPSYSEALAKAGFETAFDVSDAEYEEIDTVLGGAADVTGIQASAAELVRESEEEEINNREATRELDIPSFDVGLYLVKGLVDENIRLKGRNQYEDAEEVSGLVERVLDSLGPDGGSIVVDLDDLSLLYTSARNAEQEFAGMRGLSDQVGTMKSVRKDIQDYRNGMWPDT